MGLIIAIIGGLSLLASFFTVAACMLSARISQRQEKAAQQTTELDLPRIPAIEARR